MGRDRERGRGTAATGALVRGVLFDLDGTLLDTLDSIACCGDSVLAAQGLPARPRELYRQAIGNGTRRMFEQLTAGKGQLPPSVIEQCARAMTETYPRFWPTLATPYRGMADLLRTLDRRRVPLGVVSNREHPAAVAMLKRFFPGLSWRVVVGAGRFPQKPDPRSCLFAARRMKAPPADVVLVGDTEVDLAAARNAGMQAVAVTWGFRGRAELVRAGAAAVVGTPHELATLLTDRLAAASRSSPAAGAPLDRTGARHTTRANTERKRLSGMGQ